MTGNWKHGRRIVCWLAAGILAGTGSLVAQTEPEQPPSAEALAARILDDSGVRGGLIVHVGSGDGRLTAALDRGEAYRVQGWDRDAEQVAAARVRLQAAGRYGPVSIDRLSGDSLPYVDNLVNLLVVSRPADVARDEMLRVLAPEGRAVVLEESGETSDVFVKPRPDTIDEWTHYLRDASGNAVARDTEIGPLRRMQWAAGPRYSRHHDRLSSVSAVVSAAGRVFTIFDQATARSILVPPEWRLIARDAFNGKRLWEREIPQWHTHLWPLKSGPAQLPRRLVATGDRVYVTLGLQAPVVALDAATGRTVREYAGTAGAEEILWDAGRLTVLVDPPQTDEVDDGLTRIGRAYNAPFWDERPRQLMVLDAESGEPLWSREQRVVPGTPATANGRLVFHDGQRIVAVDARTGEPLWESEPVDRSEEIRGFFIPAMVLYEDVVLFAGGPRAGQQTGSWYRDTDDTMTALAASDGRVLWEAPHPPSGYRSPEDLLVVDGLVWTGETTSGRAEGLFTGRDLHTGEVQQSFVPDVDTYWFHHRCYRGKATSNYLLMSRTGIELVDIRRERWEPHHWVRGACLYGFMPANGLIYAPQHPCACYPEAKLDGFNALAASGAAAARRAAVLQDGGPPRWEPGPAGQAAEAAGGAADPEAGDWPMYRHDAARSGHASTSVPAGLAEAWEAEIGGRLTSPVIAGGRLLVASIDRHTVHALDADSGEPLWQFTAGGRVDSPPTVYRDRVLFGSTDGHVYALRAEDGQLIWRFRAAPLDERLMFHEQVESVWPVHGSVLVQDGVLYCVAGRSMFLDGGMRLWRLDPLTGEVLSEHLLDDRDPHTDKGLQDYVSWLNMPTAMNDILSSDGRWMYMRGQAFTLEGTRLPLERMPTTGDADQGAPAAMHDPERSHLFSPTGFLDDSGWHRTYWLYGSRFVGGWQGYYRAGKTAPAGRILVFDQERVYGFGRKPQFFRWTTPIEHHLFAADRFADSPGPADRRGPRETRVRVPRSASLRPQGQPLAALARVHAEHPDGVALARGGSSWGYALYLQGGRPHFAVRADGEIGTAVGEQRVDDRWVHLAGVLTAEGQLELYVDGEPVATAPAPGMITADPAEAMEIGADDGTVVGAYTGPMAFDGKIAQVRIYRGPVTAAEIAALADPDAETTVADAEWVLGYSFADGRAEDLSGQGNPGEIEGAQPVDSAAGPALRFIGGPPRVPGYLVNQHWTEDQPLWARALVLADNMLFVAGPPDLVDEVQAFRQIQSPDVQAELAEQAASFAGERGGILRAVSAADGRTLSELRLDSPPVFDGMAAARQRLYLATESGHIVCFAADTE